MPQTCRLERSCKKNDLKDIQIKGAAPPNILTSDNDAKGLALALPVKAGTPLVKSLVAKDPQRDGLYAGEVGVWMGVNLITSGLVTPGDLVDAIVQYDPNKNAATQSMQSLPEFKGVRVVDVVNGSAQHTKGQTGSNSSSVPAAVELAVPGNLASSLVQASAGKVVLVRDPFATPLTHNPINVGNNSSVQNPVTSSIPSNLGTSVTSVPPSVKTPPVNQNNVSPGARATTPPTQSVPPQSQDGAGTNAYNPPIFGAGNPSNPSQ